MNIEGVSDENRNEPGKICSLFWLVSKKHPGMGTRHQSHASLSAGFARKNMEFRTLRAWKMHENVSF